MINFISKSLMAYIIKNMIKVQMRFKELGYPKDVTLTDRRKG